MKKRLCCSLFGMGMLLLSAMAAYVTPNTVSATEGANKTSEIAYFQDDRPGFNGEGESYIDDQFIYCDSMQVVVDKRIPSAIPSYANTDMSKSNTCAPVCGAIVCGYYDRYCSNLIPNFVPGGFNGASYVYFPQLGRAAVQNLINTLYTEMGTDVAGAGTSMQEYKDGLSSYASGKGYITTYSSFKQSNSSVNLTTLENAINNNIVSVIFCTSYNFVYAITVTDNYVEISKKNYTLGHIMTVYGYKVIKYYRDGSNFQTDTFLYVASGYNTAIMGYVKLNDFLVMEDALTVNIA